MATAFILRRDEKEGFQDRGRPGGPWGWTVADLGGHPGSFFMELGKQNFHLYISPLLAFLQPVNITFIVSETERASKKQKDKELELKKFI